MSYLLALLLSWAGIGVTPEASPDGGVTVPLEEARGSGGPLPPATRARGENPPLVVIDPGHGGRDPGARAAIEGVWEKDVTLAQARAIRDALAASGRVRAALTREDDRFISLEGRYEIARRLGADLFISVHADAAPANEAARGATVYTLSEVASDREAALLAERENRAGAVGGVPMSGDRDVNLILIDLAQRESMEVSARFAAALHREAAATIRFQDNWRRFAAFVVLKAPDIPSVLLEVGYVTNRDDLAYLNSAAGRREIATGLQRGIEAHFARRIGGLR